MGEYLVCCGSVSLWIWRGYHMQLVSVDIETSNVFELQEGEELEQYAPFDLAVAATAIHGGEEELWYSTNENGPPMTNMSTPSTRRSR
jgi:hypothetical protein